MFRSPPAITPSQASALQLDTAARVAKTLTNPQIRALVSARDHGDPTHHLSGRSAAGGWEKTRAALMERGLLDHGYQITAFGRRVLAAL